MKQVYLVTAKGASEGSFTLCDLFEGDACIIRKTNDPSLGWGIYKFPFENMSARLWEGDIAKGYLVEWESAKDWDFNEGVNYYHNALKAVAYLKEASESEMCAIRGEYTGGSVNYYKVWIDHPTTEDNPPYMAEANDIIEALKMNYAEANVFKAIWRKCAAQNLGKTKKNYEDGIYDAEKAVFFSNRMLIQEENK